MRIGRGYPADRAGVEPAPVEIDGSTTGWRSGTTGTRGEAGFAPVTGAGGVVIGASAVLSMPTAPFPAPGRPWPDDHAHLFVPAGHRERDAHDVVLHFHGRP